MDTAIPTHISSGISPRELAARIGAPGAPLLLDVRRHARFAESTHLLATAQWYAPDAVASLAQRDTPSEVVVYCVHGHEVSQQAAATLRQAGWNARFLAGGFDGGEPGVDTPQDIAAWRAVRPLALRKRPDLGVDGVNASTWITRERPKIDRIACPWLVRRFIDPRATFLYVPTDRVLTEASRLGAVAFDIPGAPISHDGELCSFDTLLRAFELQHDPALAALARIVRAADTDRLELAPQAPGLLAISLGLSALHATDDLAMLEAAMPVYDALYAWCRLEAQGVTERHNWTPATMKALQQ
ncbi:MAG: chromate resistance protein ChrB domain-containing protein [Hydrogenophaga sp.]